MLRITLENASLQFLKEFDKFFTVALPFCKIELKAPKPPPAGYPKILKTLGDHIRKKRLDLGLLQKDVAKIIGTTESTIWNRENDSQNLYV